MSLTAGREGLRESLSVGKIGVWRVDKLLRHQRRRQYLHVWEMSTNDVLRHVAV